MYSVLKCFLLESSRGSIQEISFLHCFLRLHQQQTFNLLIIDVLDQRLPQPLKAVVGDVILVASLAFSCISENPSSRPTMDQGSKKLMGKSPLADQFPTIRLGQLF